MPLTCRDDHAELCGTGCKLIRGGLLACIVIIMLHHLSAKEDNRFGSASMAIDGKDSARFKGLA